MTSFWTHTIGRRLALPLALACAGALAVPAQGADPCPCDPAESFASCAARQVACPSARAPIPDHHRFKLRIDYPQQKVEEKDGPWLAYDFRRQPVEYLRAVLAYVREGNEEVDFDLERNTKRAWYHAPWMKREPLRGLTKERSSRSLELHTLQTQMHQNWAVSFYNAPGGWVLGKVWRDPAAPDAGAALFPEGTVSAKLLFTTADAREVPYLSRAKEWFASLEGDQAAKLRMLQFDVAVRDSRFENPTGWVFGTFVHQCDGSPACAGLNGLVPLGLAWGNDPGFDRLDYQNEYPLREGWVNREAARKILNEDRPVLGYLGRANGPVDNKESACLACHARAMDNGPHKAPLFSPEYPGAEHRVHHYFRNLKPGELFCEEGFEGRCKERRSLDYSLQLAQGIRDFRTWRCERQPQHPECPKPFQGVAPAGLQVLAAVDDELRYSRGETEHISLPVPAEHLVALRVTGEAGVLHLTRSEIEAADQAQIAAAAGQYRGADLLALLERSGLTVKDDSRIVFNVKGGAPRTLGGAALRARRAILAESLGGAPLPFAPGVSGVVGEQDELRELIGNVESIRVEEGP